MYIPDFDYHTPETLDEACGILASLGSDAKVLAGGTDVLSQMKNELIAPKVLVSLKNIQNMDGIAYIPGKGVVIGAKVTHNDLVNSELLQKRYPSIPDAAHYYGQQSDTKQRDHRRQPGQCRAISGPPTNPDCPGGARDPRGQIWEEDTASGGILRGATSFGD